MKNLLTILTIAGALLIAPVTVSADTSETVEKKVECTTGAYGQQTCKTVEVKKVLGETTPKKHETKNAGVAENIMFATLGMLAVSTAGVVYAKRQ